MATGKKSSDRGAKGGNNRPNIIIRKEESIEEPHHGGAWKVAYADFVTAMMAFFLLMWLINATTEAQKVGLADYFSQANVLNRGASGEGKPFGGRTPFDHGALSSDRGAVRIVPGNMPISQFVPHLPYGRSTRPVVPQGARPAQSLPVPGHDKTRPVARPSPQATNQLFSEAAKAVMDAGNSDPALASLKHQITVQQTPDGLKIQIMDTHKRPMFALGSAQPNLMTRTIIERITPILMKLGHAITIAGYTDAQPYLIAGHSNWDLSVERANATRQLMYDAGLPSDQISEVVGYADHDLLLPSKPYAASNRRIEILISRTREATPPVPDTQLVTAPASGAQP